MMKKPIAASMALFAALTMSACGDEEVNTNADKETETSNVASNTDDTQHENIHDHDPTEPDHDEVCAFCNMKVYGNDESMGVFTAQAITQSGERVFFDDSGCLLNQQRKTGEEFVVSWVKDLETNEWIEVENSVAVKADIETPMKYGYAFFSNPEQADAYVNNNTELQAEHVTWEQIDEVANERYQKKMQSMQQHHGEETHNPSHSDTDMNSH